VRYLVPALFQESHRSKDCCSCAYRLSYEGLSLLLPYVSKRILYASPLDFHRLLQYRSINFAHFVDARFGEEAASLMPGCCVVVLLECTITPYPKVKATITSYLTFCKLSGHKHLILFVRIPPQLQLFAGEGRGL